MSYLVLLCRRVNLERASVEREKQMRPISLKEKHANFIAVVRKWEMLSATKVKMSGREIKANIKGVTMRFQVWSFEQIGTEEKYKKVCCTCKVVIVVLLIKPLFCRYRCDRRLVYAILFFAWVNCNYVNESFAFLALSTSIYSIRQD